MFDSPFVIPIVAIVGGLSVGAFSRWLKHRETMRSSITADADWQAEIHALKARVAALETLATDTREQLRREIDSL